MAKDICWNNFSNTYVFITSEIKDDSQSFSVLRKVRKQENDKKSPVEIAVVVNNLNTIYNSIDAIDFYIYKAKKTRTIIEIQYLIKKPLWNNYSESFKNHSPSIHCKISLPTYTYDDKQKFDANWELNPFLHRWKMFWWRRKAKQEILSWSEKSLGTFDDLISN